mgnify:CR=1 FL=1
MLSLGNQGHSLILPFSSALIIAACDLALRHFVRAGQDPAGTESDHHPHKPVSKQE